jgi:hypothetical protein
MIAAVLVETTVGLLVVMTVAVRVGEALRVGMTVVPGAMTVVGPAGRTAGLRKAMTVGRRVGMTVALGGMTGVAREEIVAEMPAGLLVAMIVGRRVGRLGGMSVGVLGVELRGVTTVVGRVGMIGRLGSVVVSGPGRVGMTA